MNNLIQQHPDEFLFHEYLDGELDTAGRQDFEAHLAVCSDCHQMLADLRLLFQRVESLPEIDLRVDLTPQIVSRVSQLQAPAPAPVLLSWVALAQTAVTGLLFLLAWPSLESMASSWLESNSLVSNWQLILTERIANWGQQWSAVWEEIKLFFTTQVGALAQGPELILPQVGLALLVVSALLVCLVGNGLLLRNIGQKSLTR